MRPLPPFDQALSLRLDATIVTLENNPRPIVRYWLRFKKRTIERQIPPFMPPAVVAQSQPVQSIEVR